MASVWQIRAIGCSACFDCRVEFYTKQVFLSKQAAENRFEQVRTKLIDKELNPLMYWSEVEMVEAIELEIIKTLNPELTA